LNTRLEEVLPALTGCLGATPVADVPGPALGPYCCPLTPKAAAAVPNAFWLVPDGRRFGRPALRRGAHAGEVKMPLSGTEKRATPSASGRRCGWC
jgi:hypothetical protein